jgi:hypothetical protein
MHLQIQYRQSVKRPSFHELNGFTDILVLLTEDGRGHHDFTHTGKSGITALRRRSDRDIAGGEYTHQYWALTNGKHGNAASAHFARRLAQKRIRTDSVHFPLHDILYMHAFLWRSAVKAQT